MRFKKPIVALTAASMLVLAACGGSGDDPEAGTPSGVDNENLGNTEGGQDPEREGPVEVEGAVEGGTVTVLSYAGLNTMDPSEAYYQNTLSILQGLVTRSLTQVVYDEEEGTVLVPDLATDLGTPNEDFTEWEFTIRDGIKYENGDPVTAEDVAFGMKRSMDRTAFPEGAAFSNDYFEGGDDYKGPYTDPNAEFDGITVDGMTITIKMSTPFPDMAYWGTFPAMGPIPEGEASEPSKYRLHPLATGPYKFDKYVPEKSLTLVRNEEWDPATDPGRTAYPDSYEFDFQTDSAKIDQIMLADKDEGQTTMTYDDVQNENYREFSSEHGDRLVLGGQPLTNYWAPDYRKITDIKVRQALAWAYPYEDALLAGGFIEGVTRIHGTNLLPPGMPGREEFSPLEGHEAGETDAAEAKALLEEAGEMGYEIKWPFVSDDPSSVKVKNVVEAALKEAGFTPKPVASTVADFSTLRSDPDADLNVRTAGWLSDWPAASSWIPPLMESTNLKEEGVGANYAVFSEPEIDKKINDVLAMPIEEQAAAWNDLDEEIQTKYFPIFVTTYGGVAQMHGSKINGFLNDPAAGMPTWKSIWVSE